MSLFQKSKFNSILLVNVKIFVSEKIKLQHATCIDDYLPHLELMRVK